MPEQSFVLPVQIEDSLENLQLPAPELVTYYSFLDKRIMWLNEEVDVPVLEISKKIIEWNLEDQDKPVEERKPIRLLINSPGGDLIVCMTLVDTILTSKTPIIGVNIGEAASAAAIIFTACHKRIMFPHSYFLLHLGSGGLGGTYQQTKAQMEAYDMRIRQMKDFLISRIKVSREELDKRIDGEWYIYQEEALKLGICDKVATSIDELLS